ncbi:hypothetical protein V8E53_011693 [Lactarius tabidus]
MSLQHSQPSPTSASPDVAFGPLCKDSVEHKSNWAPEPLDVISVASSSGLPTATPAVQCVQVQENGWDSSTHTSQNRNPCQWSNGPLCAISGRQARERPGQGTNQCMCCIVRWRSASMDLAARKQVRGEEEWDKDTGKEIVVVVDDEDEEEVEKEKTYLPTSLDQVLATAFNYNSANPNKAATVLTSALAEVPPVGSGGTR